jgi:uncharacterized protein (DUF169 family)
MNLIQRDFVIFDNFKFERKPVAVKYLLDKPQGIDRLDKNMRICEMLKEAQAGIPFYADKGNLLCAGQELLGIKKIEDNIPAISGVLAAELGIFKEPCAAQRVYPHLATLPKNTANYIAFSTLDKTSFYPDVLIITASVSQAEILLRASTYTEGKVWVHKITPFAGCSWIYIYPYLTGELNYTVTGLAWGMKAHEVFPEGLFLISIPFNLLPTIIQNLKDMKWVPEAYALGKEEYDKYLLKITNKIKDKASNALKMRI